MTTATRPRIGEAASLQACPRCRRHVLIAYVDGLLVRADPENLGPAGETAARLQNRLTYDIQIYGLPRRMYLTYRDVGRIRAARKHPVIAQHRCGNNLTLISGYADDAVTEIVVTYRKPQTEQPPF
jgi:hypothetical protein